MPLTEQGKGLISSITKKKKDDPIARVIAMSRFTAAVSSLEEVVDYETEALEKNQNPNFNDINARKTRGLRDLNQSMEEVAKYMNDMVKTELETLLSGLATKLERNSELLKVHLEAVSELSQMIQDAARQQETDGTYDPFSVNNGRYK